MLADVVKMPGSPLPAVNLEAQQDSRLPALLCRRASVSESPGEPLELWLILVLADLSVTSRAMARLEDSLTPAAHKDARVEIIAPLMLTGLLGRVPPPLPASGG